MKLHRNSQAEKPVQISGVIPRITARIARKSAAFTRVELLAMMASVIVLLGLAVSAMAHNRQLSARIICLNNLRQIGVGMAVWGNDHRGEPPHHVMYTEGGTKQHPLAANAWIHFAVLSNGLQTAKVLFCPSDTGTPARDFSFDPADGYLHPGFRNGATSYFLTYTYYGDDHRIQSGDRNIYSEGSAGPTSYFPYASYVRVRPLPPEFRWMPGLHGDEGNLLFSDGQVHQVDTTGLRFAAELGPDFFASTSSRWYFVLPR